MRPQRYPGIVQILALHVDWLPDVISVLPRPVPPSHFAAKYFAGDNTEGRLQGRSRRSSLTSRSRGSAPKASSSRRQIGLVTRRMVRPTRPRIQCQDTSIMNSEGRSCLSGVRRRATTGSALYPRPWMSTSRLNRRRNCPCLSTVTFRTLRAGRAPKSASKLEPLAVCRLRSVAVHLDISTRLVAEVREQLQR